MLHFINMKDFGEKALNRFFRCQGRGGKSLELLAAEGFEAEPVPGVLGAWREVRGEFALGESLAWYFGLIYIQDLASMLPPLLLGPGRGSAVLDMCAAPGGKSAQLADMVGEQGVVVANEPLQERLHTLRANVSRLNLAQVVTTGYAGENFPELESGLDYILVDAPCSGWGTALKNPEVHRLWTREKIRPLLDQQTALLDRAASLLAPGGTLVYSTCTTNEQENQEQIYRCLKEGHLEPSPKAAQMRENLGLPGLEQAGPGMLLFDGRQWGAHSFFLAALEKPRRDRDQGVKDFSRPRGWKAIDPGDLKIHNYPVQTGFYLFSGKVFLVPDAVLPYVHQGLKVRGFYVGKQKKNKFLLHPRRRLFLDPELDPGYNATDPAEVRKILGGQSIVLSRPVKRDLTGFYWQGLPLGWLKVQKDRLFWSEK